MPAFFTSLAAKAAAIGLVFVIILTGWLYIGKLRAENATQALAYSQLQAANSANVAVISNLQEKAKRYDAIEAATEQGREGIDAANAAEHAATAAQTAGALSPLLVNGLNQLRAAQ